MRPPACSPLILTLLIALLFNCPSHASEWFPIDTGRLWVYAAAGSPPQSATVEAPVSFAEALVQPFQWDSGARDYYSQDGAGRVFLHGVTYPDGSYVVFDPPMLRVDADLTLGQEWEAITEAIFYTADGVEDQRRESRSTARVIAFDPVDVPAGTFDSVEILRTEHTGDPVRRPPMSDASAQQSTPAGVALLPALDLTFRDTYGEQIGWIRRTDENATVVYFELVGAGAFGVPNRPSSWGALKAQFGN